MTIKKHGGIFGRNPTFNDVNVDGDLTVSGNLSANIEATTVTADSTVPLTVNRTGSQGDTIQIEDDGTKIGTVGVKGGALFLADVSGTGLRFESNGIVMTDGDGDKIAASYSLGLGAYPIGSIFLGSGHGIYMDGNNGLANKFDDYEEGTWTPVFNGVTGGSQRGTYTKVGDLVTAYGYMDGGTATVVQASVTGLPFAAGSEKGAVHSWHNTWTPTSNGGWVYQSGTNLLFITDNSLSAENAASGTQSCMFVAIYKT